MSGRGDGLGSFPGTCCSMAFFDTTFILSTFSRISTYSFSIPPTALTTLTKETIVIPATIPKTIQMIPSAYTSLVVGSRSRVNRERSNRTDNSPSSVETATNWSNGLEYGLNNSKYAVICVCSLLRGRG